MSSLPSAKKPKKKKKKSKGHPCSARKRRKLRNRGCGADLAARYAL